MNDVYVTSFIVLAALLFAPLYLAPRRPWTAVAILLGVGLALGLALASKWVALYAIGGIGLLVLFRSALGRIIALLGMMGMTAVLGSMAIRSPVAEDATRNWVFLLLMLLLTGLLTAGIVRRPIPFTRAEVLLAVAMPVAAGFVLALLEPAGRRWAGHRSRRGRGHDRVHRHEPGPRTLGTRRQAAGAGHQRLVATGSQTGHTLAADAGRTDHRAPGHLHPHLHALGRAGQPMGPALAGQPVLPARIDRRWADPGRPHRVDVPVPRQPARGACRVLAVVGLAAGPQTGVVLPGALRRRHHGPHLRHRQPGGLLDGRRRRGLQCLDGLAAAQPGAGAGGHHVGGDVVALGSCRPGRLPVPRLRQPALHAAGARLLPR